MGVERVVQRRRAWRDTLLNDARRFVQDLAGRMRLRAAVVIGSVARGDFNRWSDVDLLVVVDEIPERALDRLAACEPRPAGVQVIPWTPEEWRQEFGRGNPLAIEAVEWGVWLEARPPH